MPQLVTLGIVNLNSKLVQKSVKGVFIGYPQCKKGFRIWLPNTKQIAEVRDVRFRMIGTNRQIIEDKKKRARK